MKRLSLLFALAAAAAIGQTSIEDPSNDGPEPLLPAITVPSDGMYYPPPYTDPNDDNNTIIPPGVPIVIGPGGELIPKDPNDGDKLPDPSDNVWKNIYSVMQTALLAIKDAQTVQEQLIQLQYEMAENACTCKDGGDDGGGDPPPSGRADITGSFVIPYHFTLKTDGHLVCDETKVITCQDGAFKTDSNGPGEGQATFAKIAVSGYIYDAYDYDVERADISDEIDEDIAEALEGIRGEFVAEDNGVRVEFAAADSAVLEELTLAKMAIMDVINAYHSIEEGVPDAASNILAKVAFTGDYNNLTNTPTIKVEEDTGGEGGGYKITLVSGEDGDGSMPLAKVAITGKFGDLSDIPEGDLDVVKDVSAGGDNEITISYGRIHFSSNGLEWAESGAPADKTVTITCDCDCGDDDDDSGGGSGGSSSCSCENCGGGGCSCQIKNGDDVNDVEKDPEWSKWKSGEFDEWKTQIDKDVTEACAAITAICEHIGYVPNVWQSRAGAGGGGQGDADDMP